MHSESHDQVEFGVNCFGVVQYIYPKPVELAGDDHEPPIGIAEGSCHISFPTNAVDIRPQPDSNAVYYGQTYNKYEFIGTGLIAKDYTGIAEVRILTERKLTADSDYVIYKVPESDHANINLWLHPSSLTNPPDIIIQGFRNVPQGFGSSGILTARSLQFQNSINLRKHYYNKANPPNPLTDSDSRDVRLIKWQLVRGEKSNEVLAEDSDQDSFIIHVIFHHPPRP